MEGSIMTNDETVHQDLIDKAVQLWTDKSYFGFIDACEVRLYADYEFVGSAVWVSGGPNGKYLEPGEREEPVNSMYEKALSQLGDYSNYNRLDIYHCFTTDYANLHPAFFYKQPISFVRRKATPKTTSTQCKRSKLAKWLERHMPREVVEPYGHNLFYVGRGTTFEALRPVVQMVDPTVMDYEDVASDLMSGAKSPEVKYLYNDNGGLVEYKSNDERTTLDFIISNIHGVNRWVMYVEDE
jgi:hypothetical protein